MASFLPKLVSIIAAITALLSILYQTNVDVKHTLCFLAGMGYLDFLGTGFLDAASKCMAETSTYYLKRDFAPGSGKILKVHEFDCTQGFTFEKLQEETQDFTRPVICKGLLKENKCRSWDLDYFSSQSKEEDLFRVQVLKEVEGNRRSFMRHTYPQLQLTANETYERFKKGEQIYISFDNYFVKDHPVFVEDMDLNQYFPKDTKWILHTLFTSNFSVSTLGSPFHAAPNDNFFFQCKGRKHWYYVSPHELKYTSAYIANGVTFVSNYIDEKLIIDRIPIWEGIVEEGDMMYNPPFWLHAVGTVPGFTVSVANRVWRKIVPKNTNIYFDAMYKIAFPAFISSVVWQKFVSKFARITSITLQNDIKAIDVTGGGLKVID